MPPKKKSNKKADDWESELGETAAPAPVEDVADDAQPEEDEPAGGLMAMMRKRQKKKKGKQEDYVEGEEPEQAEEPDLSEKAPVEASIEDEFALPDKKGKGKEAEPVKANDEDDELGADGKVLTKAQKEKLKKEREKQRKKENVSSGHSDIYLPTNVYSAGRQEENPRRCHENTRSCEACRGQGR